MHEVMMGLEVIQGGLWVFRWWKLPKLNNDWKRHKDLRILGNDKQLR